MQQGTVSCFDALNDRRTVAVPGLTNAVKLVIASGHACAIVRGADGLGSVWCWKREYQWSFISNTTPQKVSGLRGNVIDVATGNYHACAVVASGNDNSNGDIFCWGTNIYAQLGQGYYNATNDISDAPIFSTPLRVKGLGKVKAVHSSDFKTCAVTASWQVWCWGLNNYNDLPVDPSKSVQSKVGRHVLLPAALTGVCT
jgi:alpha-tubulin suppressor-like RCC1 family protein